MKNEMDLTADKISGGACFYTVSQVMKLTGWSEAVVLKLFNDPKFPSADYGRAKIVEQHALISFFSVKRCKADDDYWKRGDLINELRRRAG